MNLQGELKSLLIAFLGSGDEAPLRSLLNEHPEVVASGYGDYPDFHRIMDISIGGKCYRVCRKISDNEKITLAPIDEALDEAGVPIWLDGEKLRQWAKTEEDDPSDESANWEDYR